MRVEEIMTQDPCCCTEDTLVQEVAQMMMENDCGEIPVTDERGHPRGVVTDRDICMRIVAKGKDPMRTRVSECMTTPVTTVTPQMSVEQCCKIMEKKRVRRVPVVNEEGKCCGIISQADLAKTAPEKLTAEVVREVSRPEHFVAQIAL